MDLGALAFPDEMIQSFCQRWNIIEFAVFGSVLGDDFGPHSDLDILITFSPQADWGLFDRVAMQLELENLLGRAVDLVSRRAIEQSQNWIRRDSILSSAQVVYPQQRDSHDAG
jgi:predicted nucleotidyltransferase